MSQIAKYEMMVLLRQEFNDSELKIWGLNYAKVLKKLNSCQISVISRGKRDLAYSIKGEEKSKFIQIDFLSVPKYLEEFVADLKFDSNVLRFLILNKKN
jgi:ribosomal protein S6